MLEVINDFLSGKVLIVLIVGLGSYFTIRSRFVQLRHFFHMFAVFRDSLKSSGGQRVARLYASGHGGAGIARSLPDKLAHWTEVTLPGIQVATGLGQRLLAIHHARAGLLAQFLDERCSDLSHVLLRLVQQGPVFRPAPLDLRR